MGTSSRGNTSLFSSKLLCFMWKKSVRYKGETYQILLVVCNSGLRNTTSSLRIRKRRCSSSMPLHSPHWMIVDLIGDFLILGFSTKKTIRDCYLKQRKQFSHWLTGCFFFQYAARMQCGLRIFSFCTSFCWIMIMVRVSTTWKSTFFIIHGFSSNKLNVCNADLTKSSINDLGSI